MDLFPLFPPLIRDGPYVQSSTYFLKVMAFLICFLPFNFFFFFFLGGGGLHNSSAKDIVKRPREAIFILLHFELLWQWRGAPLS